MDAESGVNEAKTNENVDEKLSPEKLKKYLAEIHEKIKTKKLLSTKPMQKDKKKCKSSYFEIWNVVYNTDKTLLENVFQCEVCDKVLRVFRKHGTGPLRRHACVQNHNAKKNSDIAAMQAAMQSSSSSSSNCLTVDSKILAKSLETFTKLGHEYGPIESEKIQKILPATYKI